MALKKLIYYILRIFVTYLDIFHCQPLVGTFYISVPPYLISLFCVKNKKLLVTIQIFHLPRRQDYRKKGFWFICLEQTFQRKVVSRLKKKYLNSIVYFSQKSNNLIIINKSHGCLNELTLNKLHIGFSFICTGIFQRPICSIT